MTKHTTEIDGHEDAFVAAMGDGNEALAREHYKAIKGYAILACAAMNAPLENHADAALERCEAHYGMCKLRHD